MSLISSSSSPSIDLQQQQPQPQQQQPQQQQQQNKEAAAAAVAPTTTGAVTIRDLLPNLPQSPAVANSIENEQQFLREFENQVLDLIRLVDRRFPYKQSILWSIEYSEEKGYCIHVMNNRPQDHS
jgi:hypothetical protein